MKKLTFAFVFAALVFTAPAQAETVNCTAITTLPYTITTQGVYCLTGHLSTGIASGGAITINTNNVVLDLNGFKLGGLGAGLGTQAYGIYALERQNITIRNGTVRGFFSGIILGGTSSSGNLVEDMILDFNRFAAVWVDGSGNVIRNNQIVSTGGNSSNLTNQGILVQNSTGTVINNNRIIETGKYGNSGAVAGIAFAGTVQGVRVDNNVILNSTTPTSSDYVGISGGSNSFYTNNVIRNFSNGILANAGKCMNNLTDGITILGFSGCTLVGVNN